MLRCLTVLALAAMAAAPVSAQEASFSVGLGAIRRRSEAGTNAETLQGPAMSVRAGGWLGRWGADLRFAGGLPGNASRGTNRNILEGTLLVAYRAGRYVAPWVGAHAWWQVGDAGGRRYTLAEVGLQTRVPLGPSLSAHGEAWIAPIGATSTADDFGLGRGGAAGVTMRLPRSSLQIDLTYRIDRGTGNSPTVAESLEYLSLSLEVLLH
jgi:hypothetical protein